jgi:tetratricopeptide (TPR) repeat protein
VQLAPTNPEAYVARGSSYHFLGQHDKGIADRTTAITLDPGSALAWTARGNAYFLLDRFDEAVSDLKQAARLDPNNRQVQDLLNLAEAKADQVLAQAVVKPTPVDTVSVRLPGTPAAPAPPDAKLSPPAETLSEVKLEAAPETKVEAKPEPKSEAPTETQADAKTETVSIPPKPATPAAAAVHAPKPAEPAAAKSLPSLAAMIANLKTASAPGTTPAKPVTPAPAAVAPPKAATPPAVSAPLKSPAALGIAPVKLLTPGPAPVPPPRAAPPAVAGEETASTLYKRGHAYIQDDRFEEAIEQLNGAIKLDPAMSLAYNARGYAHMRMLQYQEALSDFDVAIMLNPDYANAYMNRSSARRLTANITGADADAAKLKELTAKAAR